MSKNSVAFFSLFFLFLSCSSLQERRCHSSYAIQEARSDVENGRLGSPGLAKGRVCEEAYTFEDYRRDYQAGVVQSKSEFCTSSRAAELAQRDAELWDASQASLKKLNVCMADAGYRGSLQSSYERAFEKTLCRAPNVEKSAIRHAKRWITPLDELPPIFDSCSSSKQRALFKNYRSFYFKELAKSCTPIKVTSKAISDARDEKELARALDKLSLCPENKQGELLGLYRTSYNEEVRKMNDEHRLELEQQRVRQQKKLLRQQREQLRQQQELIQKLSQEES